MFISTANFLKSAFESFQDFSPPHRILSKTLIDFTLLFMCSPQIIFRLALQKYLRVRSNFQGHLSEVIIYWRVLIVAPFSIFILTYYVTVPPLNLHSTELIKRALHITCTWCSHLSQEINEFAIARSPIALVIILRLSI